MVCKTRTWNEMGFFQASYLVPSYFIAFVTYSSEKSFTKFCKQGANYQLKYWLVFSTWYIHGQL